MAIEDQLVRFSVGVNLAFLDKTVDEPREATNELSPDEADRVLQAFRQLLSEQAPCHINGERVEPEFERIEIFTDPDPGMIAIFPKMGARALIRATAVLRFDAPAQIETVELTWPAYPLDQLAQEMERSSSAQPRMYFEAVLTADGKSAPARFTQAEPTLRWSRADNNAPDPLLRLPAPLVIEPPEDPLAIPSTLVGLSLIAVGYGLVRRRRGTWMRVIPISGALVAVAAVYLVMTSTRMSGDPPPLVGEDDAERIFRTLHESMYDAFDYTAESDIYDRLDFALHGDLLGELYEQIRLSLLQAEEEMKVGVVTGLQPIETRLLAVDPAGDTPEGLGFEIEHRWRVDGTVYHWGHSHTRAHVYEARYRVAYTPEGWRLTEHELLSQMRIDPTEGTVIEDPGSVEEQLDELGFPDI